MAIMLLQNAEYHIWC